MLVEFRSLDSVQFTEKLKSIYEKAKQKKDPENISFYRTSDSLDDLDSLVKRNLATDIFPNEAIKRAQLKEYEEDGGTTVEELKLMETWVIRDKDFTKVLDDVFQKDSDFYFHLLTGALSIFKTLTSEEGTYYRPTKHLLSLLKENKTPERVFFEAFQDGIYWNVACAVLRKLLFKCSVCNGVNCKEENLPYLYDEYMDYSFYFPCPDAVESMFSALHLAHLVLVERRKIRASEKAKETISDLFSPLAKAVNDANTVLSDLMSVHESEKETLKVVLKSQALNYDLFRDNLLEQIEGLKKAEKVKDVEKLLLQVRGFVQISEELNKTDELENVKNKLNKSLPEDLYDLLRLCEDEDDIKSFAHCSEMMRDMLGTEELEMYLFTSLKIFLSLLKEFSLNVSSDPFSVQKVADSFAALERESRERAFDSPDEEYLFRRFTEEKISNMHKRFDLSKSQAYHYSIVHITPTIASALDIPFKKDRSLYNKPIRQKISNSVGTSFDNAILVFIDGLGLKQLQYFKSAIEPKQNTLRSLIQRGILVPLKSVFPTETFCCLYSIFNALRPDEHKVVGKHFMIQDGPTLVEVDLEKDVGPLTGEINNFFKACANKGFRIGVFSQTEDQSRFVRKLLFKGVPSKQKKFVYKPRLGELFKSVATFIVSCLQEKQKFVLQIYIDEADSKWHDDGPFNKRVVEEINDKLRMFLKFLRTIELPPTLLAVFSDHGLVHTSGSYVWPETITQEDLGAKGKLLPSGLRLGYIYFEPAMRRKIEGVTKKVRQELGEHCDIIIKQGSDWRGHETFPDIMIYPRKNDMFTLKEVKDPLNIVYQHQGAHGACSFDEMFAVLILFSTTNLPEMEI